MKITVSAIEQPFTDNQKKVISKINRIVGGNIRVKSIKEERLSVTGSQNQTTIRFYVDPKFYVDSNVLVNLGQTLQREGLDVSDVAVSTEFGKPTLIMGVRGGVEKWLQKK